MVKLYESSSESSHFIFFDDYEEERFEEFVQMVKCELKVEELRRDEGPFSTLVTGSYEGCTLILTSGSFEGCFICIGKEEGQLVEKIKASF